MISRQSGELPIIAGPCAIESFEQMEKVAKKLKSLDIGIIRGGAFKPRTSASTFQGLGIEGLKILDEIRKKYNLISVTEVMDTKDVEIVAEHSDIIQIGTRNMHNYSLLKEVGKVNNPVILKRGFMSTIKEFLSAAEYITSNGNENVILCERGIRTFEASTRFTLDISCVPILQKETPFPVIVDISHSLGRKDIMIPIAKAVQALGADGMMVETHPNPKIALSDADQQLDFDEFEELILTLKNEGEKNSLSRLKAEKLNVEVA